MKKNKRTINFLISKIKQSLIVKKHPNLPWLPYDTIKFLEQYLKKTDTILEIGSGRSTIWFAKLVQKVVSLEHDKSWYNICNKMMQDANIKNIEYHFADKGTNAAPLESDYIKKVATMPDNHFDFILIDGRHRVHIAQIALQKIKPGGMISIDNVERELYLPNFSLPDSIPAEKPIRQDWIDFLEKTADKRKVVLSDGITANMLIFM